MAEKNPTTFKMEGQPISILYHELREIEASKARELVKKVLMPFSEFQLDTKHLLDKSALPKEVYEHMKDYNLPLYEWNLIDVGTRTRFPAYSYELGSVFGLMFIVFAVLWLRAHNVRGLIKIRMDNGMEFCGGSERKLRQCNMILSTLGVILEAIPAGAKHLMAIVDNSHRDDDEYFLMIHAERCNNTKTFLYKAQPWQDTWNFYKPSHDKGMHGLTPYRKLKKSKIAINSHVLKFPVLLMEDLLKAAGIITMFLKLQTGKYVPTKCLCKYHLGGLPF